MVNSDMEPSYKVEVVNFLETRLDKVKVMICQLDFDQMDYKKGSRLLFLTNEAKNKTYIRKFLKIAARHQVDLLVFPELTIPAELVKELVDVSKQYDMYIIGGTHYKKNEKGYLSVCPIVTPQNVYYTEKITPAPIEASSFVANSEGAVSGKTVKLFHGTKIGDFAVTICLDYTNNELRTALDKDKLDFLIVTAFNSKSEDFFLDMHLDVQKSADGLYLIYSNTLSKAEGKGGRSALFAYMDNTFKTEFVNTGCTDLNPSNKIYEFTNDKNYCVFELDLRHKRPYLGKNEHSTTNVWVLEEDLAKQDERNVFLSILGVNEDRYKSIDQYYVKPREYDEMLELLENENVLVITGDPGIGKTYTAIHFLWEYFKKGYRPIWFYGMAKEDRDEQQKYLLDFEPQTKDVIYIEDPFGKTVFENRDELKTLFGNLVQKFRDCKAKLIITSRTEVFNQFEKEVLNADKLDAFKKELNIRKPSYSIEDLKRIATQYIKAYACWWENREFVSIVMTAVEQGKLVSPFMVYNLVRNHQDCQDEKVLEADVENARNRDLVTQFAEEIKGLSHPAKILLYLVLLYGRKNISLYREMFVKVQNTLFKRTRFDGSSMAFELKRQENHRIQRLGEQIPVYRFSHPAYEEALIALSDSNDVCALIVEVCVVTLLEEDDGIAAEVFNRFIMRYPIFLENIFSYFDKDVFDKFSDEDKMNLTRKMLSSNHKTFQNKARNLYPIKKVLEGVYNDDDTRLFELRIRTLNRRKDEISDMQIEWNRVFTTTRINKLNPITFLCCYELAASIDDHLIDKIECNFQKTDLIKKFILLPTDILRTQLNGILGTTAYKNVYQDLLDKIPGDIRGTKINRWNYSKVLRKYILKKEQPKGMVEVDLGAMQAMFRYANLYPIGVLEVTGNFENGDIVYLVNRDMGLSVLSLVGMSSDNIRRYKGLHSSEIYELAGQMITTSISKPTYRDRKAKRIHF